MTEGERIRQLRKSLGLTLEKFGNILGVSKVSISNIENGNTNVTERMRKSICREFNIDYDWLLNGGSEDIIFTKKFDDITEKEKYIDHVFANEGPFARSVLKALAKFSKEEWDELEHFVDNAPMLLSKIQDKKKK